MSKKNNLESIPDFKSEQEEANFWTTHDTTEYAFEDTDESITLSPELKHRLEKRRGKRLRNVLELDEEKIQAVKNIAKQKNIAQHDLIRQWIEDSIERELSR